jgi:LysR family transcriptional regulator, transcriptional activator of the cysJI operon
MTFDQLLSFLTASETGSFTEAGNRLSQSQSSISQQIKALENELGIPLFERAYRSLVLTTGGKALLPYALRIRQELEAARSAMAELKGQVSGPLRIGASTTNGNYLLPSILLDLKKTYSQLFITMVIENDSKLLEGLQHGKVDILLLEGERPQALDRRFDVEPFYEDQLVVVKNTQFKLKKKMTLNDVIQLPWIMREIGSGTRELLLKRLQENQLTYDDMSILMEVGTIEAIKLGLLQTEAVSYLSRLAVDQELKTGQLDIVDLNDLNVNRQLWLVSPLKPYRTMPMKAFRKALFNSVS